MRKFSGFILVIACCVLLCVSCGGNQQSKSLDSVQAVSAENTGCVYVCNGKYAKRYHRTRYCSGLNNCQGGVAEMPIEEAKTHGLTPCRKCY